MTWFESRYDPFSITAVLASTDITHARTPISNAQATTHETTPTHAQREQRIDEELAQSFPASDPPSWVRSTAS
ncbi:MAG TPA: hypothetical protein VFN13_04420 [Rudaea sp.]|nr:hypothetical protein [Rudaea sp.]